MKKTIWGGLAALALSAATLAPLGVTSPAGAAAPSDRAAAIAASGDYLDSHRQELKATPADAFVRTQTVAGGQGLQYVAYERTYRGLPVVGGDFVVVTDNAEVVDTSVAQNRPIRLTDVSPSLSRERASSIAKGELDSVTSAGTPRLVVWHGDTTNLAWETELRGTNHGEPSWQFVYVDAKDGSVLEAREQIAHGTGTAAYSGPNPLSFGTTNSSGTYTMRDPAATSLVCQDSANNTTFSGSDDAWGNGSATSRETGCVDAFYGAQQMRMMMTSWLGRNGMDGSGGWVPLRVGLNDINAYYDGTQVQIGHNQNNQWIGSLDVVAHEYGHGVDSRTPGGISRAGTQEFVGDVFGVLTEYYDNQSASYDGPDWTVGEEVNLVGQGPIRDMANPAAAGDPVCYTSSIPTTEVHAAAGPGNHFFYLLSQGGTSKCDGTSVSGIGIQKAGKIMYNAMLMKTSSSSYLRYRTWTLTAAKNLYAGSCAEYNAVKAAWDAVNVPAQSDEPTCDGGTTPPPPTGGNLLVNSGFESGASAGWTGTAGPITDNTGRPARTGSWKMWLGGNGTSTTETEQQTVTIPATATAANLSYWIRTDTAESGSTAYDTMRVQVVVDGVTTTLRTFSNVGTNATYTQYSHSLLAYKGKSVTVKFTMTEDSSLQTSFVVDDTAVSTS